MFMTQVNHCLQQESTIIYGTKSMMADMIGDRLKQLRTEAGLTQEAFAAIAKTTKQYVSQLESGKNQVPGPEYLDRWARHYGVNLHWLLTGRGQRERDESSHDDGSWVDITGIKQAAALGDGATPDEYAETHKLKFRADSLRRKGLRPENLAVIYGKGDSMAPTIDEGDAILFDRSDTTPRDGKLFVITYDGDLYAKRLMELDGIWYARSDNDSDPKWRKPRRLDPNKGLDIAGRIRWIARWVD